MRVSYDGIEFKILTVSDYVRELVYTDDEATYLYDHVGIRCTCWLNPAATGQGQTPVTTELQLVKRLSQPRKKLLITMDDGFDDNNPNEQLILSPKPGREVDARVGPLCRVHGIMPDHGNGSLVVDLEFNTWIATCDNGTNSSGQEMPGIPPSPILSNRWSYIISYAPENYAETRIIHGMAIFRMDELIQQLNGNADLVRQYLVPPKAAGYQRGVPEFELSTIGDSLKYTVVDVQVGMSMPHADGLNIANISVKETRKYSQNIGVDSLSKIFESTLQGAVTGSPLGPPGILAVGGTAAVGQIFKESERAVKEGRVPPPPTLESVQERMRSGKPIAPVPNKK